MKKNKILFVIAVVLLAVGFSHVNAAKRKATEHKCQDYRGDEVAFVKEGKLYFYYPYDKEIKPLKEETEPVFNCVFDNTTDRIYYTVERDSLLWLKKADYKESGTVKITEIVNLKVKKEQCVTETYGEKAPLIFNRGECVVLPYHFEWNSYGFTKMVVYSTLMGDPKADYSEWSYEDVKAFHGFEEDIPHKVTNNQLIYNGRNLSKDLSLEVDEEMDEIMFTDFKFSKDHGKLLFGAFLGMGDLAHGPYCVADIDGTHQQLLVEDGLSSEFKPFWVGNQAVFLRYKQGISDEETVVICQLCITDAADNGISVIQEGVDYFTVRELYKPEPSAVTQSEESEGLSLDEQEIVTLSKPPFRATFAEQNNGTQNISLQQLSVEPNDIIDDEAWFVDNELSIPVMNISETNAYADPKAPLEAPGNIPRQWAEFKLIKGIKGSGANFYLYGDSHIDYHHLLITDAENTRILHLLDFWNYVYSDDNRGDFIDMRVQWAAIMDNILYISSGHSTYAKSSNGINAFVTAIDLSDYKILWQSDPLVSNAGNFEVIGDNIVCGYGFTAEPDYLYVLDRYTGKKVQTLKLASGPSYIIQKDEKLYVRTYNKNYVFQIKNHP